MHWKREENPSVELKAKIKMTKCKKVLINQKCPFFRQFFWQNCADFSSLLLAKRIEMTKNKQVDCKIETTADFDFFWHQKQGSGS